MSSKNKGYVLKDIEEGIRFCGIPVYRYMGDESHRSLRTGELFRNITNGIDRRERLTMTEPAGIQVFYESVLNTVHDGI